MSTRFRNTPPAGIITALNSSCEIVLDYLQGKITRTEACKDSNACLVIEWIEA